MDRRLLDAILQGQAPTPANPGVPFQEGSEEHWIDQPLKPRGTVLSLGEYEDGSVHPAWPGLLAAPAQAWGRMMDGTHQAAMDSNDPELLDALIRDSFDAASGAATGGLAAAPFRPTNSVGVFGGRIGAQNLAKQGIDGPPRALEYQSKNAIISAFPERPQRPFHDDYPASSDSVVPEGTPLAQTIDGHPLTAPFIAGRRVAGGPDQGLSGPGSDAPWPSVLAARELVDHVESVPQKVIGRDAGRYLSARGLEGPKRSIRISDNLRMDKRPLVLDHELGHAIDDLVGRIPVAGISKELDQIYDDGLRGGVSWGKKETPKSQGYKPGDTADRELIAEAVRAYIENPNYVKSIAPKTAKSIRDYANKNPHVSGVIQFNANPKSSAAVPMGMQVLEGAPSLPMDFASRMSRAREMGFDTEAPLFHGTAGDLSAFDLAQGGQVSGSRAGSVGVSSSPSPEIANEFARRAAGRSGENSSVLPLLARRGRQATLDLDGSEKNLEVAATLAGAWDAGYESVMLRNYSTPGGANGTVLVVKNPNQMRSKNAAFDLSKSDSADLLASNPNTAAAVPFGVHSGDDEDQR